MTFPKRTFDKPIPISPTIALDRERCILCYRCTRFSEGVAEDGQLVAQNRGAQSVIATFEDEPYRAHVLRQRDRALPGRRADLDAVPLRGAAVGDPERPDRLRPLPGRLQHRRRRRARARSSAILSPQPPRGRRGLALRQGPLRAIPRSTRADRIVGAAAARRAPRRLRARSRGTRRSTRPSGSLRAAGGRVVARALGHARRSSRPTRSRSSCARASARTRVVLPGAGEPALDALPRAALGDPRRGARRRRRRRPRRRARADRRPLDPRRAPQGRRGRHGRPGRHVQTAAGSGAAAAELADRAQLSSASGCTRPSARDRLVGAGRPRRRRAGTRSPWRRLRRRAAAPSTSPRRRTAAASRTPGRAAGDGEPRARRRSACSSSPATRPPRDPRRARPRGARGGRDRDRRCSREDAARLGRPRPARHELPRARRDDRQPRGPRAAPAPRGDRRPRPTSSPGSPRLAERFGVELEPHVGVFDELLAGAARRRCRSASGEPAPCAARAATRRSRAADQRSRPGRSALARATGRSSPARAVERVPSSQFQRPDAEVELAAEDASRRGIATGDDGDASLERHVGRAARARQPRARRRRRPHAAEEHVAGPATTVVEVTRP